MKSFVPKNNQQGFFKTWVPLVVSNGKVQIFEKELAGAQSATSKTKFLRGVASNANLDKERDRMHPDFIKKMRATAVGLNVFVEHEHSIEKTVGVITEADGDDNNNLFIATTELEPEENNPLVGMILKKISHGIKIGYSISGRVNKAAKISVNGVVINEILDGELYEVSLTAMPAAYETWVAPLQKSAKALLDDGLEVAEQQTEDKPKDQQQPEWSMVSKKELPFNAYAKGEEGKPATWGYPHHYSKSDGTLAVHLGGLAVAWLAAVNDHGVRKHLNEHAKIDFGLDENQFAAVVQVFAEKQLDITELYQAVELAKQHSIAKATTVSECNDLGSLTKALSEIMQADKLRGSLSDLFWSFREAVGAITFSDLQPAQKQEKIMVLAAEYSEKVAGAATQLATLLNSVFDQLGVEVV